MTRIAILAAAIAVSACSTAEARPKPVALNATIIVTCPTTGSCRLIATWSKPSTWRSTDSLGVAWAQTTPVAATWPVKYTRGTADTLLLPRTAEGSYAGTVKVTTYRAGASPSAAATATWTAGTIVTPPDTVTSLQVTSVIVKPDSAKVFAVAIDSVTGKMKPATDSNRVLFCAAVRLSDDTVILTTNSDTIATCPKLFAGIPGYVTSARRAVFPTQVAVHVEATPSQEVINGQAVGVQILHVQVADAFYYRGEWWLKRPQPLKAVS